VLVSAAEKAFTDALVSGDEMRMLQVSVLAG
jgi:hypothetical protein